MATIDIDKLTKAELTDLNHRVVERLRFLQQMRAHAHMLDFSIGERVSFQMKDRSMVKGIVTKYNQKRRWSSPSQVSTEKCPQASCKRQNHRP